jgi:hypothetical protein
VSLSGRELVKPFNTALGVASVANEEDNTSELPDLLEDEDEDNDDDDDAEIDDAEADEVDELEALDALEKEDLLAETAAARAVVSKLRSLSYAILRSTTHLLPAWNRLCIEHNLKVRRMPRDVVTRWNSTYNMLAFMLLYRKPIDAITADKAYKVWKFELEGDDWKIVQSLASVLKVCLQCSFCYAANPHTSSNSSKRHSTFRKTARALPR